MDFTKFVINSAAEDKKNLNDANSIWILSGLYVTFLKHIFNQNPNYIIYTIFKPLSCQITY